MYVRIRYKHRTNVRSEVFGMKRENKKKRIRLVNKRRFVTVVMTCLLVLFMSVSVIISASAIDKPIRYTNFVVHKGDTLWSIAEQYVPQKMDIREYIIEIEKVNPIDNSFLAEGREIILPDLK